MPRPHVPASALEHGCWRRGTASSGRALRVPPTCPPLPLSLTLWREHTSLHAQPLHHTHVSASPLRTADTAHTKGSPRADPVVVVATPEVPVSPEAWLLESARVLERLLDFDDVHAHAPQQRTAATSASAAKNSLTASYAESLAALEGAARFAAQAPRHRNHQAHTEEVSAYTSQIQQRSHEMERVILERLDWLKARFHAQTGLAAGEASEAAWPLKAEMDLRRALVLARVPLDTCTSLALLVRPAVAPAPADARARFSSPPPPPSRKTSQRVLLYAARTLARSLDELKTGNAKSSSSSSPDKRQKRRSPQGNKSKEPAGASATLSALPYGLYCLCTLSAPSARAASAFFSDDVAGWQTDAADAFCAVTPTSALLRDPACSGAPKSLAMPGMRTVEAAPAQPSLFPTLLTRAGVFERAWSPFVSRQMEATTTTITTTTIKTTTTAALETVSLPFSLSEETEAAQTLTHALDDLASSPNALPGGVLYHSTHFTPFWSLCLSWMLREGWRAVVCVEPAARAGAAKSSRVSKATERARVFHAVGAFLSFRRLVSSMHRHGQVLPILELHRMVTGTAPHVDPSPHEENTAKTNATFLAEAARHRARLMRWSSTSSCEASSWHDAPSSTDALLWREAVLFDAYTLITVGHTSEGAVDVLTLPPDQRAAAASYVDALQELCLTHLLQLEAVETDKAQGTRSAVLHGTHPLLWSLLTPRTRATLCERLREALRLGTKFHLRVGNGEAVRVLYARCPSMGGSWEVGRALAAAGHHAAALAAFQSLLHSLAEANTRNAVGRTTSTMRAASASFGASHSDVSPVGGVPRVLAQWLLEAITGTVNTQLQRHFAALMIDHDAENNGDGAMGAEVLLSESAPPAATSGTSDPPRDLVAHARATAQRLEKELWASVREGCAPLPAAVCLNAFVDGLLYPSSRARTAPARSDAEEATDEEAESDPATGPPPAPTPARAEDVYRLVVAATWLSGHATTVLSAVDSEGEVLEDGLLHRSVEALLHATLDLATRPAESPDLSITGALEAALDLAWRTIAELVRTCAHVNLLASCVSAVVRRHEKETCAETGDSLPLASALHRARLECGLRTLLAAVLDGLNARPASPDTPQQLSDAYVLSALASVPTPVLASVEAVCTPREAAGTHLSARAALLLHTARATTALDGTDEPTVWAHLTAVTNVDPVEEAVVDVATAAVNGTRTEREPWQCRWCQTWNSKWAATCKHCTASAISLVQCGGCGSFGHSAQDRCTVCRTTLASTSSASTASAADADARGALAEKGPRAFALRAWSCHGCGTRNAAGHTFYCVRCHGVKPELQAALAATVFTCTTCQTRNPLGMLKPWCFDCGTLAPAAAAAATAAVVPSSDPLSEDAEASPSLWYCLQCGQLNPWVHGSCASCGGRRRRRHRHHPASSRALPSSTTATPVATTTALAAPLEAVADLAVPWCTLTCTDCGTAHPAWCVHGTCRSCRAPLRTSAEATALYRLLRQQWQRWEGWAWQQATTLSVSPLPTAPAPPTAHLRIDSVDDDASVQTRWPIASTTSVVVSTPPPPPPLPTRTCLDVHLATSVGWVCWPCGRVHATTARQAPHTESSATALVVCPTCRTAHSTARTLFIRFDDSEASVPAAPTSTPAGAWADATATVFTLATSEAAWRLGSAASSTSSTSSSSSSSSSSMNCAQCGAAVTMIHPSGVCGVCGVCTLASLSESGADAHISASEWRVRLRLLLRDMSTAAEALVRAAESSGTSAAADTAAREKPTKAKKKHHKNNKKNQNGKKKKSDLQKDTHIVNGETDEQRGVRLLISGIHALRRAPREALPWVVPSSAQRPSDTGAEAAPAHVEALEASRHILRALTITTLRSLHMDGDKTAMSPSPSLSEASPSIVPVALPVPDVDWERQRPSLRAALDLIDVWNDTMESDELGFDSLRAVCLAIRPEQRAHIDQDTRWQFLANMKLTRAELVRGVVCEHCLSRKHKTGDAACSHKVD